MEDLTQTNKPQLPFNIKIEIEKLKISIPLTELVNNESYRSQITETLNIGEGEDVVNLNDDQPDSSYNYRDRGKKMTQQPRTPQQNLKKKKECKLILRN